MSIFGATETPVLDFWWHLLQVSKREKAALFTLGGGVHDIYSLRFTSGVTPLPVYMASIAASYFPHVCFSRGGMPDLNQRPPAWQLDALTTRPQRPGNQWIGFEKNTQDWRLYKGITRSPTYGLGAVPRSPKGEGAGGEEGGLIVVLRIRELLKEEDKRERERKRELREAFQRTREKSESYEHKKQGSELSSVERGLEPLIFDPP